MNAFSAHSFFRLAAILGFLGVALGAFGAHALKGVLAAQATANIWETAVFYHLLHAAVMLGLTTLRPWPRGASVFLLIGVLAFSGSLYAYALTKAYWLVFVTPLGGLCFLLGWLLLALRQREPGPNSPKS